VNIGHDLSHRNNTTKTPFKAPISGGVKIANSLKCFNNFGTLPEPALHLLRNPNDLGMVLKLSEHLLTQGIGDLGVDPGILDVLVA
jgi:hypothetical protein